MPAMAALTNWARPSPPRRRNCTGRTAIIASGDMSHRLKQSAPCGYHPDAHRFDETFISLLRKGAFRDIRRIDASLQDVAAEDVADSTTVALAATGYRNNGHAVLSYEGPFGVGYGVAILFEPADSSRHDASAEESAGKVFSPFEDLPAVARCAVEAEFIEGPEKPWCKAAGELTGRHGVFVTLRTDRGELRGCRGTLQPVESDLVQETWRNAGIAPGERIGIQRFRARSFKEPHFAEEGGRDRG